MQWETNCPWFMLLMLSWHSGVCMRWEERKPVAVLIIEVLPEHKGHCTEGQDPRVLAKLGSQILFPVSS